MTYYTNVSINVNGNTRSLEGIYIYLKYDKIKMPYKVNRYLEVNNINLVKFKITIQQTKKNVPTYQLYNLLNSLKLK